MEELQDITKNTTEIIPGELSGKPIPENPTPAKPGRKPRKPVVRRKKRAAPIRSKPPDYDRDALSLSKEDPEKKAPTQPWRPASMLTARKIDGKRSRWVRKDLLEKRIEEGWQPRISNDKSRVEVKETTIVDGKPLGSYVTKRNMILCDMPEEMAKSREDYYRNLSSGSLKSTVDQLKKDTTVGGSSKAYGKIEINKEP